MLKNILIFRTDRIGDLIVNCPTIITIKKFFPSSKITLITSEKNFKYANDLEIFDHIYEIPKKNILKKISFIFKLSKKEFDYVLVFDGKDRSIITSLFIKSKYKVALSSKNYFFNKIFNIKFIINNENINLIDAYQKVLDLCNIKTKISNFDFLLNKKNNNFSSQIDINNYVHIHLDEKWRSDLYIESYTNINPNYDEFIKFIETVAKKNHILITTGISNFELIDDLKNKYFSKINEKIFNKKIFNNSIFLIYKPTYSDLESMLRNSKILVSCHGSVTHAANCFNVKNIDVFEKRREKFYKRFAHYLKKYHPVYRNQFSILSKDLINIIDE